MRAHLRHSAALVVVLAVAVAAARGLPYLRFSFAGRTPAAANVARGVLHVHLPTDVAAFDTLVRAARRHRLDFILFTSVGGLDSARDGREGYYMSRGAGEDAAGPILVLIAAEVPTDRGNLLVIGGTPDARVPLTRRSDRFVAAAKESGGVALALAPCDAPPPEEALTAPYPPDPPAGVSGVEAISLASMFSAQTYFPLAVASALAPLHLDGALASLAPDWRPERGVTAVLDWPGPAAPVGGVGREPGRRWGDGAAELGRALRWVTTRLSLRGPLGRHPDSFAADRAAILEALASGRSLAAVEAWGDPSEFSFTRSATTIRAEVAGNAESWIVLRQGGRVAVSGPGPEAAAPIDTTGDWRAEVYRRRRDAGLPGGGWLLWIVAGEGFAEMEPAS